VASNSFLGRVENETFKLRVYNIYIRTDIVRNDGKFIGKKRKSFSYVGRKEKICAGLETKRDKLAKTEPTEYAEKMTRPIDN